MSMSSYPRNVSKMNRLKESPKHSSFIGSRVTTLTGTLNLCRAERLKRRKPYSNEYSTMYWSSTYPERRERNATHFTFHIVRLLYNRNPQSNTNSLRIESVNKRETTHRTSFSFRVRLLPAGCCVSIARFRLSRNFAPCSLRLRSCTACTCNSSSAVG